MRNRIFVHIPLAICAAAGFLFVTSFAAGAGPSSCGAPTLELGGVAYAEDLDTGYTALLAVEVPAPGFLAVEIGVTGFEENVPWVEVLPSRCPQGKPGNVTYLERTLTRQVLAVSTPGTYPVRVGAVDPRTPLRDYALSVRFLAPFVFKDHDGTEDPHDEIVPIILCDPLGPAVSELALKDHDGTEDPHDEIVPIILCDPLVPMASEAIFDRFAASCNGGEASMFCARELTLAASLDGELGGGPQGDFFTFTLDRAREVRVESDGEADTLGTLYDAMGHRLLTADDGGPGESFALTAHLPPGRYFVRVEGALGAAGDYRVRLSGSDL